MRIGLCCSPERAIEALDAGFEYVELPAYALGSSQVEEACKGLPVEVTNLFFPGEFRLNGPAQTPYLDHSNTVIAAAARLGVKVMVVGSGGARATRCEVTVEAARAQFVKVATELLAIASPLGIVIAPEALNHSETDVWNLHAPLAAALRSMHVAYTLDTYHLLYELDHEPSAAEAAEHIPFLPFHVHVSNRQREAPDRQDRSIKILFNRLRELGYDARVSIEANWGDGAPSLAEAATSLRSLTS